MKFSREEIKALSEILHERIDHAVLKEEILQDIDEELRNPEAAVRSGFIEAGIDYLSQAEGVRTPVFSKTDIRKKIKKIRKAARTRTREKRVIIGIGKAVLAACMGIILFISANYIYIEQTGKCMFSGMFDNMVCYIVGYPVQADMVTGMVTDADASENLSPN